MLGKLFKYELRSGVIIFPIMYAAIGLLWLLGRGAVHFEIPQMLVVTAVLLFLMVIAPIIVAVVYTCVRFHKSLFGAEGYLMQTLPVGKGQLILVKALLAFVLLLLGYAAAFVSVAALLDVVGVEDFWSVLKGVFGEMFYNVFIFIIVSSLIQLISYVGIIFFSITLANTKHFVNHNVLFAILFYLVISFVVGIIESIVLLVLPLSLKFSDAGTTLVFKSMAGSFSDMLSSAGMFVNSFTIGLGTLIVDVAAGVGLLIAAKWLMTKKTMVK